MPPETPHSQMEPTNLTAESRPTVRSDLAANSWSIKRAKKTGSLYLGFAALLVTMLGVALTYSDHLRNKEADRREDLKSFQELLAQAEQLYCEQAADGYTYDIRRVLLRAQQLVPRVQSRLLPIDYLTLASVGSEVGDPLTAEEYATKAIMLCQLGNEKGEQFDNESDDLYAAFLTRGHIRFCLHCETGDPQMLKSAQSDFDEAIESKNDRSERSKLLRGEAWLKRGSLEGYCGQPQNSEDCFTRAQDEWKDLSNGKHLGNKISLAKRKTQAGMRPQVDCPARLALTPSQAIASEDDAPPEVQSATLPPGFQETMTRTEDSEIIDLAKSLLATMNQLVKNQLSPDQYSSHPNDPGPTGDVEEARRREFDSPLNSDIEVRKEKTPTISNGASSTTGSHLAENSSIENTSIEYTPSHSINQTHLEFDLINSLNSYETVFVNRSKKRYRLAPGQKVHFIENYGDLVLTRARRRRTVKFQRQIFWDPENNKPKIPLIEITGCCFRQVTP